MKEKGVFIFKVISTELFLKLYLLWCYLGPSLSTLTVQTLAIMFRGTEGEPARLDLLSAEK